MMQIDFCIALYLIKVSFARWQYLRVLNHYIFKKCIKFCDVMVLIYLNLYEMPVMKSYDNHLQLKN